MERPDIKGFFQEANLKEMHETYLKNEKLFKYTQELDNYIDYL